MQTALDNSCAAMAHFRTSNSQHVLLRAYLYNVTCAYQMIQFKRNPILMEYIRAIGWHAA